MCNSFLVIKLIICENLRYLPYIGPHERTHSMLRKILTITRQIYYNKVGERKN